MGLPCVGLHVRHFGFEKACIEAAGQTCTYLAGDLVMTGNH